MRQEKLDILTVGNGAREHALDWAIGKSPRAGRRICAPGNGGIEPERRRKVKADDVDGIVQLAKSEQIDFVVVGPEVPLVAGLVDRLKAAGIAAFGPIKQAARLEGSKIFTKRVCDLAQIPTSRWTWTRDHERAVKLIQNWGSIPVIKADGLCAGKGVIVPETVEEAIDAAHRMLVLKEFGDAGSRIVIEQRIFGRECSVMVLTDGRDVTVLPVAQDHKRLLNNDKGPNTGGMGAFAPSPYVSQVMIEQIKERIIMPVLRYLSDRGTPFCGLLYAGIMLTHNGPRLIEFNVRFGDPETQVVLPLLSCDVLEYLLATTELGRLSTLGPLSLYEGYAVGTVLASNGYPEKPQKGFPITISDHAERDALLFHAGTERSPELITDGGRVMSVVGVASSLSAARDTSQTNADLIAFQGKQFRTDIAADVG